MRKNLLVAALALAVIAAAGCSKGDSAVIARVNQTKITVGDYKRQLEGLDNIQMEQAVATDAKARKEFLEDLIGIELALQEAKRQGLDKDADYKKNLETIKKEYEDRKKRLEKAYQDASKNELFKALIKKELTEKANKLAPPTDKEVRAFYDANRDKMIGMNGKRIALKDVEPQIKQRLMQEKQRDLYLEFVKGMRDKAKVTIDEPVLNSALSATATLKLDAQPVPAEKPEKKSAAKQ